MNKNSSILTRRTFLRAFAAGTACASLPFVSCKTAFEGGRPPNFVLIFTDDQGYNDLGCFGSPKIETPRIDRMAAEGMKFTSFYVAAPICSASRAALMTGCYPMRVSIPGVYFPKSTEGLNPDEVTVADLLKSKGYATACVGKWHLGHHKPFLPTSHGFDYYFGIPYSNDMGAHAQRPDKKPPVPLMRNEEVIEAPVLQDNLTERYTEEAVQFIRQNHDRPFFLYLPHTFPHVPLYTSDKFRGTSRRGLYGDVIEAIDWSTGRILDTLKELGLDDNTLVMFTSDNGPWLGKGEDGGSAHPLRDGKFSTFEGGMRVPCVVRWPGRIPAGAVCNEIATAMDVLPTYAELAGATAPTDRIIDGKNIWPLMAGEPDAKTPHEAFFYYQKNQLQAVRSGRWKLVLGYPTKQKGEVPEALYDLETDIGEQVDRRADHPQIVERLRGLADKMRVELGDSLRNAEGANTRPAGNVDPAEGQIYHDGLIQWAQERQGIPKTD